MTPRPRSLAAALALGLAVLFAAAPALACRCVTYASARAQLATTGVVFVGRVVATRQDGQYGLITTFAVAETLKGRVPARVEVRHSPDVCCICGVEFQRGPQVMVLANRYEGVLRTDGCTQGRFSDAQYRAALARRG